MDEDIEGAREVLAAWLDEHYSQPRGLTGKHLRSYGASRVQDCILFTPPGMVNREYLVRGREVVDFAPSSTSLDDALAKLRGIG